MKLTAASAVVIGATGRVLLQPISGGVNDAPLFSAISQGGLDLWFEQTSDLLAGRQCCV
ncbi:MAG: hypothetical protein ABSG78_12785 [Verrucomicrobiota bacterium]